LLGERGYETVAFSNNSWLSGLTELTRGFSTVEAIWRLTRGSTNESSGHPTVEAVRAWLAERDRSRPFFLFVNLIEPHWPYNPPDEYLRQAARDRPELLDVARSNFTAIQWYAGGRRATQAMREARAVRYEAEVLHLDAVVGELLGVLDAGGVFEDSLVAITADHGENLGERGHQGHSFTLYESTLHVPLLIRPPRGAGSQARTRTEPVYLPDVFTTLARAAGVGKLPADVVGLDLLADPLPADRSIVGEYYEPITFLARFPKGEAAQARIAQYRRRIRSIQVGNEKLIWASDGNHELYDLEVDPRELENVAGARPERVASLSKQLEVIVSRLSRSSSDPRPPLSLIDPDTIQNLRALGYVP